jgi:hypothetical protein
MAAATTSCEEPRAYQLCRPRHTGPPDPRQPKARGYLVANVAGTKKEEECKPLIAMSFFS